MVKLNTQEAVYAGPKDVELTLAKYPGFKLEIAKNSVTFPGGAREGYISVTAVNAAAVPMAPPNGMQPRFIVTIQPTNTLFDAPARLTLPNVDGHPPGAQVEMYSYDHDLEEFVSIGLGTVSEDGSVVKSNPGVGVIKAGWHCGSQPGGSGTAEDCGECNKCDGTTCIKDPAQNGKDLSIQTPEDCQTATCDGGKKNPFDNPKIDLIKGDCKKPGCGDRFSPDYALDDNPTDEPENDTIVGDCRKPGCNGGLIDPKKNTDDEDKPRAKESADNECKKCAHGSVVADPEKDGSICGSDESQGKCNNGTCDSDLSLKIL